MPPLPERQTRVRPVSPARAEAQLQRLAEALAHAFRIGEGRTLVDRLGSGGARDNREALAGWVRAEVSALDAEVAGALLPILIDRLERRLRSPTEV